MATKPRTLIHSLLVLAIFLLCANLALPYENEDPEVGVDTHDPARQRYERCRQQCQQHGHDEQQRRRCEGQCEVRYQQERRGQSDREDPEQQLRECKQQCRQRGRGWEQQRWCEQSCEEEYREHCKGQRGGSPRRRGEGEMTTEKNNPYFFGEESFRHEVRTDHGHIKVLQNFAKRSPLLLGIANFRIGILEAGPHAFVLPHHLDADVVFYVARGRGTITLICQDKKESHCLDQGDILKAPAGAIIYLVNKDNNEKLTIVKFMNPVSTPGRVEAFSGAGGENPESYFREFSEEILEAAFNTRRDRLERLWQQRKGAIVRASEEQVRALSRHTSEGGGQWPFGGESRGTFNLLKKRPCHSSRRGRLYEADGDDYRPLRELDIQVSFANLTRGSMIAPYYNSRATKIAIVTEGRGYLEIVCPHVAKQHQRGERRQWEGEGEEEEEERGERGEHGGPRYQKIRSRLSPGTVVVIPAGHPSVTVASRDHSLQAVCFEVHAEKNEKNFLVGKNNVWNQMDREAKELAFDMPAREVDEVFRAQREEVILEGPEEHERRREEPMEAVLELAGVLGF